MSDHQISIADAKANLLYCAAFMAENIKSADGYATALTEIIPLFLEKGEVDLAAGLADSVEDPFMRDLLLTQVAEKCSATDDDEYAFQLIEAIEDYGNQLRAREKVALQKAYKNDLEKAFEIAEELEHPDDVFSEVALREAMRGDFADALETVEEIEFPYAKVSALQNIALVYIKNGEKEKAVKLFEDAKKTAEDIEFDIEKIRAFVEIGNNLLHINEKGKAIETFDKVKSLAETLDNIQRDSFLADAALGFLQAGSVDLADRSLDLVSDKTQMIAALLGFSHYFHSNNEETEAHETLEEAYAILKSQKDKETRDSRSRFRQWMAIAMTFANYEKDERALEIATEITEETTQMSALAQIAKIFASKGKDDFAEQAVKAIGDDANKMFAFIGISDAKAEAELNEDAVKYLNEAHFYAGLVDRMALRSDACNDLASRFAAFGDKAKAREICSENLEIIPQIKDESVRAVNFAKLAGVFEEAEFELNDAEKDALEVLLAKSN